VDTAALLDIPLPTTKMRRVYALLGLVKRWGAPEVDAACAKALEAEAVSVALSAACWIGPRRTTLRPSPRCPKTTPT
jgi:hypothetical protein